MSRDSIGLTRNEFPEAVNRASGDARLAAPLLPPVSLPARDDRRPRRISPQAFAVDQMLSHSIEYLTDARALPSGKVDRLSPDEPDVQAVMLLMGARHEVYMACPVIERRSKLRLFGLFKGPDRRRP